MLPPRQTSPAHVVMSRFRANEKCIRHSGTQESRNRYLDSLEFRYDESHCYADRCHRPPLEKALVLPKLFFCTSPSFSLPAAGLFSCSWPRSTQGVRVYARRILGPGPSSVTSALGFQSREKWQVTTGSVSDDLEPTRPIETRNNCRIQRAPLDL